MELALKDLLRTKIPLLVIGLTTTKRTMRNQRYNVRRTLSLSVRLSYSWRVRTSRKLREVWSQSKFLLQYHTTETFCQYTTSHPDIHLSYSKQCFNLMLLVRIITSNNIALLAVQSSAVTFLHNAISFIDTSNNAWYNQVHWLIGTPYLSMIASNVGKKSIFSNLSNQN